MHMAFFIWWSEVSSVAALGFCISVEWAKLHLRMGKTTTAVFSRIQGLQLPSVLLTLEM